MRMTMYRAEEVEFAFEHLDPQEQDTYHEFIDSDREKDNATNTPADKTRHFSYECKRTCGVGFYDSFAARASYHFFVLRRTFLKVAELSENLEPSLILELNSESASSSRSPPVKAWLLTLIELIEATRVAVNSEGNFNYLVGVNTRIQPTLVNTSEQISWMETRVQDFRKQFAEYEANFRKLKQRASEIFPLQAAFQSGAHLNAEFAQIRDIAASTNTSILSPSVSEASAVSTSEDPTTATESLMTHLVHEKDKIFVDTKSKSTTRTRQDFGLLATDTKVRHLETFLMSLCLRLEAFNRGIADWSHMFTRRLHRRLGRRSLSYLDVDLLYVKKILRKHDAMKLFPIQQARCFHAIWKLHTMIQNTKMLLPSLCSVVSLLARVWTTIFQEEESKFTLESFDLAECKKLLQNIVPEADQDGAMIWSYALSPTINSFYWCHNIVAPPQPHHSSNSAPVPLMLQLLENDLMGIMDFQSEFSFRVARMSSVSHVFEDDVKICSCLLQRLHLNSKILVTQFRRMEHELVRPQLGQKFAKLICAESDQGVQSIDLNNSVDTLIMYLGYVLIRCLELTLTSVPTSTPALSEEAHKIESCLQLYVELTQTWTSSYRKLSHKYKRVENILNHFEKLRRDSENLLQMQDYKPSLASVEEALIMHRQPGYDENMATPRTSYGRVLVQIGKDDLNFATPSQNQRTSFSPLPPKNKVEVLQAIRRLTEELVSSRLDTIQKTRSLLRAKEIHRQRTKNNSPSMLIMDMQNLLSQNYDWNELEILIAVRSLRHLLREMHVLQNELGSAMELYKTIEEWILKAHRKLSVQNELPSSSLVKSPLPISISILSPTIMKALGLEEESDQPRQQTKRSSRNFRPKIQ